MFPTCSLVKIQYCGDPPWQRSSELGLRPPGLEFRILCLEDSDISFISPCSLYVHNGGLKPHPFHFFQLHGVTYGHLAQSHGVRSNQAFYASTILQQGMLSLCRLNVGLMLVHRLRRWPKIKPAQDRCVVLTVIDPCIVTVNKTTL